LIPMRSAPLVSTDLPLAHPNVPVPSVVMVLDKLIKEKSATQVLPTLTLPFLDAHLFAP